MSSWKRFWTAVLGWSAALGVLLGTYALIDHFTTDTYRGPGASLLALHGVAREVGLFFPLTVFFAALGVGRAPISWRQTRGLPAYIAAPVMAGVAEYIWLAFLEPWTRFGLFLWDARLAGVALDPRPVASTQVWLAAHLSNPAVAGADARFFGWLFHLPIALGLLTMLLGVAGFLLGHRAPTTAQRWTMAAFMSVVVAPMLLTSLRLSTRFQVPPAASTYGMLVLPLVVLAMLGWLRWTESESAPPAATS